VNGDWFDWLGAAALGVAGWLTAWLGKLSGKVNLNRERLAVMETTVKHLDGRAEQSVKLLGEIRDEVKALREDGDHRARALHENINDLRLETKEDQRIMKEELLVEIRDKHG
jgi:hypothetical protein